MTDLVVSILILAAYLVGCVGWWARHKQLDRNRAARHRIRRINAYTMGDSQYARQWANERSNVVSIDTYSRKVDAA